MGARKPLEFMGLDPDRLARSNDFLEVIQEHVAKIGNQNIKLSVMRDLFGRDGAQMLNVFETNLREVRQEFDMMKLGVSMDQAAEVEKFNDRLVILKRQAEAAARRGLVDKAPLGSQAVTGLSFLGEETGLFAGDFAFQQMLAESIKQQIKQTELLQEANAQREQQQNQPQGIN